MEAGIERDMKTEETERDRDRIDRQTKAERERYMEAHRERDMKTEKLRETETE